MAAGVLVTGLPRDLCYWYIHIISLPFLCWLPKICNIYLTKLCHQGVKAVIAKSFETIHRSNLVGMGVMPLCFKPGEDADSLGLTGHERFTIRLPSNVSEIQPGQDVEVVTDSGKSFTCKLRIDTLVSSPVTWNW
jgi:hypothetical protein